ncbi:wHTH domain-containing protein [Streptomyces rubiginosohelvolus]|uniref:Uncharacterized protein n=1 Tax=Streptomyces rubiginosohelvolus TaxID=67362 RepID=A0ABQ3C242_9ACTN|nr:MULTISPECIES: caspase family protein [Streptomyces]GGR79257.1 hypothetical protein GCM10010284_10520 [Streptomyces rubiginosohelvolus]GGZ65080.1 hypothetical protein GCM10010328_44890 [Streptomyces pluricolorescens]
MNGSYRALLIGVPTYLDSHIDPLPFVTDDITELSDALSAIGYDVHTHDFSETDRESIDYTIETFFQGATQGETLLLYLSGHGIHHDGKDYLVPKGARTTSHDFRGKCLSLDFSGYVERSEAGDVVVFVDACREGITLREMSVGNAIGWSDMRVVRAGTRHYSHVYACSPGERARYTRAGNSTFSIFSRALSTVVADEAGASTLRELKEQLQSATDALTAEHKLPRQQIRVRTETETDDFAVFVRPDRSALKAGGEHPWVTAARDHPAWKQIGDAPGAEAMRVAAEALVAQIAPRATRDETALVDDPWRPVDFAERMTGAVGWLLSKALNPEKLDLSPAEAALLVAVPYLYVSCANRAAVQALEVQPTNLGQLPNPSPSRRSYEQYFNNRDRLVRRAELVERSAAKDSYSASIAWWLFRRWLTTKPGGFQDKILTDLIGSVESLLEEVPAEADRKLVAELFELNTLPMLLRSLRTSFDTTTIRPKRQLAGGAEVEQHVREQLMVVLVTVAHHLAMDPILLSDVVVEHLGINYSVRMDQLHRTIQTARWDQHGRTRVLNVTCHHPAIGLALQQQASALDALLGTVDIQAGGEPQMEPLQDLPAHATADQVRPALTADGKLAYETTDLRFRLADDRIQKLLMGEQLYGDPGLAIRELYQNALDACRYRGARTQYLRSRHSGVAHWSGSIKFKQDVDEHGRAYIECIDNGIGMGERELREVFAHAGMRFADLPEYLDEQAEWRSANIELHPNSRFGIGVLSYFMIADDVSVTTCRLDRQGHPGQRLQVDIAGPGSLFHIQDLGRGYEAGTTVRLYPRSSGSLPSCTDLLRRLLWVSEYSVVAQDTETRFEWEPNVLSPMAPMGAGDPHVRNTLRADDIAVDGTTRSDVWWTSDSGGVLADGVWIGVPLFGAVVNLTGRHVPQLTVDRRRTLALDESHVTQRMREEIPTLLREDSTVFGLSWLSELVTHHPALADEISKAAMDRRYSPWAAGGLELDITTSGCFSIDSEIMSGEYLISQYTRRVASVVTWRAKAAAAAGAFPGVKLADPDSVVPARPTDIGLLRESVVEGDLTERFSSQRLYAEEWLQRESPVRLGHVLEFARSVGCTPRETADRLMALGFRLEDNAVLPETAAVDDLVMLSRDLDRISPWLDAAAPVPMGHVMAAAERTKRNPSEVAARLAELGLKLVEGTILPETVERYDEALLARPTQTGERRWLDSAVPIPLGHVLAVAEQTDRRPAEVEARLTELGLRLEDGAAVPAVVEPDDLIILSHGLHKSSPWWKISRPVPSAHVVVAAHVVDRSPQEVSSRLVQLGLRLHEEAVLPPTVTPADLTLLTAGTEQRRKEWLNFEKPVPLGHVLAVAEQMKICPAEAAARLVELGLRLFTGVVLPEVIHFNDLVILRDGQSRRKRWLDEANPVPMGHVLAVAERTKLRPAEVASRLMEFGLCLAEGTVLPENAEVDDPAILSVNHDRVAPWLDKSAPIPMSHVLSAADRLGRRPAEVAARLVTLGLQVATDGALQLGKIELEDLRMFGEHAFVDERSTRTPIQLGQVFESAVLTGRPLPEVAHRLSEIGFTLADDAIYTHD